MARGYRLPRAVASTVTARCRFTFDGHGYQGFAGDTLASALLANGVPLVGAQLQISPPARHHDGGRRGAERAGAGRQRRRAEPEPHARPQVELYDGLIAAARTAGRRSSSISAPSTACWRAVPAGRLLLQDLHVAAGPSGRTYRAARSAARPASAWRRPSPTPTATTSSMPIATCWSSAAARPGWRRRSPPAAVGRTRHPRRASRTSSAAALLRVAAEIDGMAAARLGRRMRWRSSRRCRDVRLLPRTTAFGLLRSQLRLAGGTRRAIICRRAAAPRRATAVERARQAGRAGDRRARAAAGFSRQRPSRRHAGLRRAHLSRAAMACCPAAAPVMFTNDDAAYDTAFAFARAGARPMAIIDLPVLDLRAAFEPRPRRRASELLAGAPSSGSGGGGGCAA